MKILYYCWDEYTASDLFEVLPLLGHFVKIFKCPIANKLEDATFEKQLLDLLKQENYDCIFTFNYYPIISKTAQKSGIKYVTWIFDSPHFTLYSQSVFNNCNYIFHFDKLEAIRFQSYGVKNIYHMPLAVNTKRLNTLLDSVTTSNDKKYSYDISFLGNLYNNEYNFFDQVKGMPDYYKGFFDGIIKSQMNIYGYDLASDIITDELIPEFNSFMSVELSDELFLNEKEFFISLLQKKITVVERFEILKMISAQYDTALFSPESNPFLTDIHFKGYVSYTDEMPIIFSDSKINLNITLRSILSGVPLRCLDIMASGGFLLSNYQPELAEYFEPGKELVMYESRYDLMDKIEYYLSHDKEREEIARNGKLKTDAEFSYEKRLTEIFNIVQSN